MCKENRQTGANAQTQERKWSDTTRSRSCCLDCQAVRSIGDHDFPIISGSVSPPTRHPMPRRAPSGLNPMCHQSRGGVRWLMENVVPNTVLFVRLSSIGGFRGVDTPEALPRPRADGDNRLSRDVGVTPTRCLSLQCMTPPCFYLAPKCCAQGFAGL